MNDPLLCEHGYERHRRTRAGESVCPYCRRLARAARAAQAARTTPRLATPRLDVAALAAHDDTLWSDDDLTDEPEPRARVLDLAAARRARRGGATRGR